MTVHSRRYGRWCRDHFDAPAPAGDKAGAQAEGKPAAPQPAPQPPAPPSPRKAKS